VTIKTTNWANTPEDPDRKRRKQAELMVKGVVSTDCFGYLLTFDATSKVKVELMATDADLSRKKDPPGEIFI
jgi:ssDNA thymidine ADP-ribosyltransferase, DarT